MSRAFNAAALGLAAALVLSPGTGWACACGCGVFDIGVGDMASSDTNSGITAWFRYSFMNQNQNWEGSSKAPAADNGDKEIVTSFYTLGGQYRINPDWSAMIDLPIYSRRLTTSDDGTVFGAAGSVYTGHINDLGDLQLTGQYTGFSETHANGVSFGVKLPTGNYTGPTGPLGGAEFDRDSLPGTGSTDLLIGGYHVGGLSADNALAYFIRGRYEIAVLTRDGYRPGNELDVAAGLTYDFGFVGPFSKLAPLVQLIGSDRAHDTGENADPLNSGYQRVLLSPGIDVKLDRVRLHADIEFPIYQHTNAASSVAIEGTSGQLTASTLYNMQVSYDF